MPFWRADGVVITIPLHMGPTEFLYCLFLRALHHQYLYSRYHYHHHSSIVTEPITSVIHPFAEHIGHSIKKEKKNQKLVYNSIGFFKIMILFFLVIIRIVYTIHFRMILF
ncbi:unnamed protein product, partial [Vitis vinifera]|uniref:Fatty acid hydroxylase domain-containing protein n=1 Tax=Vitis vinifera TaxID=29760 RepID=D7U5V1_VITVI